MYKWIDHIVVRVNDVEEALSDYEGKMGLKRREDPVEKPEIGMKRAILVSVALLAQLVRASDS